jgi:NAD(P)-dependent dehydrogenase (short-subunit alcohol dehydrogenase family)
MSDRAMSDSLAGKTLIITGGFGHLGSAVAAMAGARGAKLALVDRAPVRDFERADAFGDGALLLGGVDLTSREQAEAATAAVAERFGGVDGILNIAGGFVWETFADSTLDSWDRMYRMNVLTCVTATHAALPRLLERGGSVVCISAGPALKGALGMAPYAAAKAGVARFVESLSEEVKDRGVRVNAVMPSIIDTPVNRRDMPDADVSTWVSPQALGEVLLFLSSDAASAVTGALIPVFNRA